MVGRKIELITVTRQDGQFINIVKFYYQLTRIWSKCAESSTLIEHFLPAYVNHWLSFWPVHEVLWDFSKALNTCKGKIKDIQLRSADILRDLGQILSPQMVQNKGQDSTEFLYFTMKLMCSTLS